MLKTKLISSSSAEAPKEAWLAAFESRTDLTSYAENALGLFALALRFNLDDLATVAAEAITDGCDDKKCDIVYIDLDDGYAVVAQCYNSSIKKLSAPSNKASDLNTAVTWLLQPEISKLPDRIKFSAQALRDGISNGQISHLYIWYIHNLPESKNVQSELRAVEATANSALKTNFGDCGVKVAALEVGIECLRDWYNDTQSPILVTDKFSITVDDGFEVSGPDWKGYVTSIPLQFLRKEYNKYKTKLFSANVRDYLGSKSSDSNINNSIKKTAQDDPDNFWAYNNGLTVLVNSFSATRALKSGRKKFTFSGMSIVNGAQTTGAIASLETAPPQSAKVPVRFIQTDNNDLVYDIIRFNNSQNKVTASDFRSTDATQRRLKADMLTIPEAEYEGGRRGGPTDAIRRRPNLLPSYTVGQALAAFHGDPIVAYNQKSDIWSSDTLYSKYFNEQTSARHIVFAHSLLRAVESSKIKLVNKAKLNPQELTDSDNKNLAFLRRRGSIFLLVTAFASCMEIFCNKRVPNSFRLAFTGKISPKRGEQIWAEIVELNLPLTLHLEEAFTDGLKSQEKVKGAVAKFKTLVEVTASSNAASYKKFAGNISLV